MKADYSQTQSQLDPLPRQAALLASGTLASLTHMRLYAQIDIIQAAFIDFCTENSARFKVWQDAWGSFWPLFQTTADYKQALQLQKEQS